VNSAGPVGATDMTESEVSTVAGEGGNGCAAPAPRQLIFYWDKATVPKWLQMNIDEWKQYNPGLTVEVISDEDIQNILGRDDPAFAELYSEISIPACRADIARVVWLCNHGGMYADCHVQCKRNLDQLLGNSSRYSVLIMMQPIHARDSSKMQFCLTQSVLIAQKGSRFLKLILDDIKNNLYMERERARSGSGYNVWKLTGPGVFYQRLHKLNDETPVSASHCEACAKMGKKSRLYNVCIIDMRQYVSRDVYVNYKKDRTRHWSQLQNRIPLFIDQAAKQ